MIHEFQCDDCLDIQEVLYKPSEEVDSSVGCTKCTGVAKLIVSAPRGLVRGSRNPVRQ